MLFCFLQTHIIYKFFILFINSLDKRKNRTSICNNIVSYYAVRNRTKNQNYFGFCLHPLYSTESPQVVRYVRKSFYNTKKSFLDISIVQRNSSENHFAMQSMFLNDVLRNMENISLYRKPSI